MHAYYVLYILCVESYLIRFFRTCEFLFNWFDFVCLYQWDDLCFPVWLCLFRWLFFWFSVSVDGRGWCCTFVGQSRRIVWSDRRLHIQFAANLIEFGDAFYNYFLTFSWGFYRKSVCFLSLCVHGSTVNRRPKYGIKCVFM